MPLLSFSITLSIFCLVCSIGSCKRGTDASNYVVVVVQSLRHVWLFVTWWTAAPEASNYVDSSISSFISISFCFTHLYSFIIVYNYTRPWATLCLPDWLHSVPLTAPQDSRCGVTSRLLGPAATSDASSSRALRGVWGCCSLSCFFGRSSGDGEGENSMCYSLIT